MQAAPSLSLSVKKSSQAPSGPKIEVGMYKNVGDNTPKPANLFKIFEGIKDGRWANDIAKARAAIRNQDNIHSEANRGYSEAKKAIPCFTPCGLFEPTRAITNLKAHTGLYVLDLDKPAKPWQIDKIKAEPFVLAVHKSVSGIGYAIYVRIKPQDATGHSDLIDPLVQYFATRHKVELDPLRDVTRLRFVSHDPALYLNPSATNFIPPTPETLDMELAISKLKGASKDILETYPQMLRVCLALLSEFEYDLAKGYFLQLVEISPKYRDYDKVEIERRWKESIKQHEATLKGTRKAGERGPVTIGTFWYLLQQLGIVAKKYYSPEAEKEARSLIRENEGDEGAVIAHLVKEHKMETGKAKALMARILNEAPGKACTFWSTSVNDKGEVKLAFHPADFIHYLHREGFWSYKTEGEKAYRRVQVAENIISDADTAQLQHHVLSYLHGLPYHVDDVDRPFLINQFHKQLKALFNDQHLDTLPILQPTLLNDSKTRSYLFYKNGFVEVTASGPGKICPYNDMDGQVFESSILPRRLPFVKPLTHNFTREETPFKDFLGMLAGSVQDRMDCLVTTVGYLLHRYKDPSRTKVVIFQDEVMSEGQERGGTGKGFIAKSLRHIRPMVVIGGKQFDSAKTFALQRVGENTCLLCMEDLPKKFSFENLFNWATDGMETERKNKDAIFLEYENSPKIILTTNYSLRGLGPSHRRRRHEVEIAPYFDEHKQPVDEFGHNFFSDWNEQQWAYFDNFMMHCLAWYLQLGLVEAASVNREVNALIANTEPGFPEWMDEFLELKMGVPIEKKQLSQAYMNDNGIDKAVHQNVWRRWLLAYCSSRRIRLEEKRESGIVGRSYVFVQL